MKKLRLLLAFCALLLGWSSASATDWVGNEVTAGEFYLYNVGADRYLGFGENWGTKATADHAGIPVTLVAGSGTYTIKTNVASSGNKLFVDGYMDGGAGKSGDWVFTDQNVAGKKVYTINIGEKYLYYDGSTIAVGDNPNNANGQWQLVTKDQRDAAFEAKNGSESAPLDITYKYIQNPNTTYYTNIYSATNSFTTGGAKGWDIKGANTGWWDGKDNNAEVWNGTYDNYIEIADVPNGIYEFGVMGFYRDGDGATAIDHYAAGSFADNAKIYANNNETSLQSIVAGYNASEIYAGNDVSKEVSGTTYYIPNSQLGAALYFIRDKYNWQTVRTVVTNNTLRIGVKKTVALGNDWTIADKFYLSYLGVDLDALKDAMDEAVATAEAIDQSKLPTAIKNELATVISTYKGQTYSTEDEYNTATTNINNAIEKANASIPLFADFNTLKGQADALVAVENTNAEANSTLSTAISAQNTAVTEATTAAAISTAISTLKTAMITYAGAADPTSGNRFDLTFMMTNPSLDAFAGWTKNIPGWNSEETDGNYQAMVNDSKTVDDKDHFYEYWSNPAKASGKFALYNAVTLPVGTYSMSCYAFAENQYAAETVNGVFFYANDTQGSAVTSTKLSQQSISFINESEQEVKIGLKTQTGNTRNWMGIGYVKLYKEYTDNTTYEINVGSVSNASVAVTVDGEAATSAKALKTVTMTFTPEDGYAVSSVTATYNDGEEKTIDVANPSENVYTFQMPAYDVSVAAAVVVDKRALATAISSASSARKAANEGAGVFQIPASAGTTLAAAIATAQGVYDNAESTVSQVASAVSTLNTAVETYEATTLNAPDAGDVFNVMITTGDDYAFKNNPLTFNADNASGAFFPQGIGVKAYRAQQITFTQVEDNKYTLSMVNADGNTVYIRTNATEKGGNGNNGQIRLTTVAANALAVRVEPTATEGVYHLWNTEANALLGCQDNPSQQATGGIFTCNSHNDFTITAATKPSVSIDIDANVKYATRIFPFAPTLPDGVKAYSCEASSDNVLTLVEEANPAANTPYILYAEGGYTGEALSGFGTATETSYTAGWLTGVYENTTAPVNSYVLQNNNSKVGFYHVVAEKQPTVGAYRCYLTDGENTARAAFFFRGDITGVANVEAATEATLKDGKYLENGKIVIVKNGVKYNAAGAQVK